MDASGPQLAASSSTRWLRPQRRAPGAAGPRESLMNVRYASVLIRFLLCSDALYRHPRRRRAPTGTQHSAINPPTFAASCGSLALSRPTQSAPHSNQFTNQSTPMGDDEQLCRFCFESAEEKGEALISPCLCKGDQKYVHLSCLRRWQRAVLVSQPTHPAFYDRDPRHYVCNVCKGSFTCEPPTRLELMSSFTGPELGALMETGCIIASHAEFSAELRRQMEHMPPFLQERSSYAHWIAGCYLITEVAPLEPTLEAPVSSAQALDAIRDRLGDELSLQLNGQTLRLTSGGALEGNAEADLPTALAGLEWQEGMKLVLRRDPPPASAMTTSPQSI